MSNAAVVSSVISAAQIADLLASTLGAEKALEVVDAAVNRLGLGAVSGDLSLDQSLSILDDLSRAPGMVGITARFARTRLDAPRSASFLKSASPRRERMPSYSSLEGAASGRDRTPGSGPVSSRPANLDSGPISVRAPSSQDAPSSAVKGGTVTAEEIAALLTSAMGAQQSQEVVRTAILDLGLPDGRLDKQQAMAVLDFLAQSPGVVGLCARFGKARLILRFAA